MLSGKTHHERKHIIMVEETAINGDKLKEPTHNIQAKCF